jgi:acetyltransferase-like isoleucine patch superfamily enzyme
MSIRARFQDLWLRFWMRWAGRSFIGRCATRLATWWAPPYRARNRLARMSPRGYLDPSATIAHPALTLGRHVFVDRDVVIYHAGKAGRVELSDGVHIYRGACLETSDGGVLRIGARTSVHAGSRLMAHGAPIVIGERVALAPDCALYPYDHGTELGVPIDQQPITSKGGIVIGDGAWLGTRTIVLSGVTIGPGAVVGAGSVVTRDVPADSIAAGNPARVVGMRRPRSAGSDARSDSGRGLLKEVV